MADGNRRGSSVILGAVAEFLVSLQPSSDRQKHQTGVTGEPIVFEEEEKMSEEPSTLLLEKPWRTVRWGESWNDLLYVQSYSPEKNVNNLRVLLYGPVGAGKSSFVNSVNNVLRGRIGIPASTSSTTSGRSFTRNYESHRFRKGNSDYFPLVFNDVMGLEEGTDEGIHTEDIKLAMKGRVKEGHKFIPGNPLTETDAGYNSNPSADDKVHVVVCVTSANASQIKSSVLQKMNEIRDAAKQLGIPHLAIMTHIDEACGEVEKDLTNVYRSKHLRKKMKDFSSATGISINCIFPVKNYYEEIDLDNNIDTLFLSALRRMIDFGDDFLMKM